MKTNIETKNLLLEPIQLKHISERYLSWINDKEVIKFLEITKKYDKTELTNYINKIIKDKNGFMWAIIIKKNNLHVGNIRIHSIDKKNKFCHYGIMIGDKNYWGKGIAFEATNSIFEFCFTNLRLRKIYLFVSEKNGSAVKLYKKLGFEIEGILKRHLKFENDYCDSILMAKYNQ